MVLESSQRVFAYPKSTMRKPEQWRRSSVFIVDFEEVSHIVLVFPLLTVKK